MARRREHGELRVEFFPHSGLTNTIAINETMFKSAIIASLVAGAAAFAPAQQGASSTALRADLSSEVCTSTQDTFYLAKPSLECCSTTASSSPFVVEQHQLFSSIRGAKRFSLGVYQCLG